MRAGSPQEVSEVDAVLKGGGDTKEYIAKQQRWLLFLRHCAKCEAPAGTCPYNQSCVVAKALWKHIMECSSPDCQYPRYLHWNDALKSNSCKSSSAKSEMLSDRFCGNMVSTLERILIDKGCHTALLCWGGRRSEMSRQSICRAKDQLHAAI